MRKSTRERGPHYQGTLGENWSAEWADILDRRQDPDAPAEPAHPEEFCWCLLCERAFPVRDIQVYVGDETLTAFLACPTEGCDGGLPGFHLWRPGGWVRSAHPEYPEVPVSGASYPLY